MKKGTMFLAFLLAAALALGGLPGAVPTTAKAGKKKLLRWTWNRPPLRRWC